MSSETSPLQVVAFNDTIGPLIQDFLEISTSLGEPIIEMALQVKEAFHQLTALIEYGLYVNQPTDEAAFFAQHPLSTCLQSIQDIRNKNRNSEYFNHLSCISESILALSWVAIRPAPKQFISEMIGAAEFYGNRVLSSYKNKADQTKHVAYVQKYLEIMKQLETYVKLYFICGFTWGSAQGGMIQPNPQKSISSMGGMIQPNPQKSIFSLTSGPPPPPPPPAQDLYTGPHQGSGDGRPAYLADLNVGTQITNRLRHVDKNEKKSTLSPPVSSRSTAVSQPQASTPKNQPAQSPKFELDGRKWVVAYQIGNRAMKLQNEDMSQSLLMHNCQECYLQIENKINNVVIDSCKKTDLLIHDVISSVELIRCERLKIQCDGFMPMINIAGSEQVEIFLNEKSRNCEIIASKSSSINICLMRPDGDYVELPMPEQIKSVISKDDQLKSTAVDNI